MHVEYEGEVDKDVQWTCELEMADSKYERRGPRREARYQILTVSAVRGKQSPRPSTWIRSATYDDALLVPWLKRVLILS